MKELTITFDNTWLNKELEEYISSLKGVLEAKVYKDKEAICIKYDPSLISIKVLKLELSLFLDITTIPSIIAFDKHPTNQTINTFITIKDICCEYCYRHIIEELLSIEGIESAYSDYSKDYFSKYYKEVAINITYNLNLTKEDIHNIEKKLNNLNS